MPRLEPEVRQYLKETNTCRAYGYSYYYSRHVFNGESLEGLKKVLEGDMSNKEKVQYALAEIKHLLILHNLVLEMEKELQEVMKEKN